MLLFMFGANRRGLKRSSELRLSGVHLEEGEGKEMRGVLFAYGALLPAQWRIVSPARRR